MSVAEAWPLNETPSAPGRPVYRCYFIDVLGTRRVVGVEVLESADDDAAKLDALALFAARNRGRLRYGGMELWDRDRLVHVHPPLAAEPPAER